MAIDRRREARGGEGGGGRYQPPPEENGALPAGGGRGGEENRSLPSLSQAAAAAAAAGSGGGGSPAGGGAGPSALLVDYDASVLPLLGGLGGGYQKTLVLLTWIPALFIGFSQYSDSFLLAQPDYWCRGARRGSAAAAAAPLPANWTGPPPTWGPPPTGPAPAPDGRPRARDAAARPDGHTCHQWHYRIRAGLVQNVVSKTSPSAPSHGQGPGAPLSRFFRSL
ncbi:solute carrier family 22 member 23-like [Ornithorhynchus anatinus]|uniref:solute carrier family 22 member 23-like n=1 Tax=Ornithorhynchus anatinus TaxID=9258 RepID=UPI0019D439B1|nr:solute carrier family 22 member 23-like [Ornithorhynchus anatinus]